MYKVYCNIFECFGFDYCFVIVDIGFIGGSVLYEFYVFVEFGEDVIVFSDVSDYVVNIEKVEVLVLIEECLVVSKELKVFLMFDVKIIVEFKEYYGVKFYCGVKILIVYGVLDENE